MAMSEQRAQLRWGVWMFLQLRVFSSRNVETDDILLNAKLLAFYLHAGLLRQFYESRFCAAVRNS